MSDLDNNSVLQNAILKICPTCEEIESLRQKLQQCEQERDAEKEMTGTYVKESMRYLEALEKIAELATVDMFPPGNIEELLGPRLKSCKEIAQQALQNTQEQRNAPSVYSDSSKLLAVVEDSIIQEAQQSLEDKCEHGIDMTEYCQECGRINGESEDG